MDHLKAEIERLIIAKQQRRHRLAAMSFPEKVRAVVRMQQMVAPQLSKQGKKVRVWEI